MFLNKKNKYSFSRDIAVNILKHMNIEPIHSLLYFFDNRNNEQL